MPIKNVLQRFQPVELYVILVLSVCYFSVQLVLSHLTHALTLLMASYHMLCNIFALAGCIITIKHSNQKPDGTRRSQVSLSDEKGSVSQESQEKSVVVSLEDEERKKTKRERREMKLRNTFGWTRIDILTMLIVCIILASLSLSLLVEALQTLVHIDHQDTMHLPIPVLILGFIGLILNGITYFLIGGYTMHQGSFLHVTPSGEVVLDKAMSNSGDLKLKPVERQLSKTKNERHLKEEMEKEFGKVHVTPKRQGTVQMLRDLSSTVFVIVCAVIVYMAQDQEHTAKFIDPVLSIFSCVLLIGLSYPYMKESCLILLQTIPGCINMENFERNLVAKFPEIVSYHDLHIWQLSAQRYVATIHIKFKNPKLFNKIIDDVQNYFHEHGVNQVTIQPEFHSAKSTPSLECLVQCNAIECIEKVCCKDSRSDLRDVSTTSGSIKTNHLKSSLESLKTNQTNIIENASVETIVENGIVQQYKNIERQISGEDVKSPAATERNTKDITRVAVQIEDPDHVRESNQMEMITRSATENNEDDKINIEKISSQTNKSNSDKENQITQCSMPKTIPSNEDNPVPANI